MSKSKNQRKKPATKLPALPAHLVDLYQDALTHLEHEEYDDALDILIDVQKERPDLPGIDFMLAGIAGQTRDYDILEASLRKLVKAEPKDIGLQFRLGAAYLLNDRLGLGYSLLSGLIEAHPEEAEIGVYREMVESIAEEVESAMSDISLPRSEAVEFLAMSDEVHYYLADGQVNRAVDLVDQGVRRWPNIGKAYDLQGTVRFQADLLQQAVQSGLRAVELSPNDTEARVNLVRFLTVSGRIEEAKAQAATLLNMTASNVVQVRRSMFSLALVSDFVHVIEEYERYRITVPDIEDDRITLYIAGGGYAFLGQEDEARRLWQKVLEIDPSFNDAIDNLEDLDKRPGDRMGPFVFRTSVWLTQAALADVLDMDYSLDVSAHASGRAARKVLRKHPEIVHSTPHILRNAHYGLIELLCDLAVAANDPSYLAHVVDYVSGRRYSDNLRRTHVVAMSMYGQLTAESIPFWSNGEYHADVPVARILHEAVDAALQRNSKLARELEIARGRAADLREFGDARAARASLALTRE